jgi:cell division protease FtsH
MQLPLEDRYIISKAELVDRLTVLLGGRASEELIFNETTTGAHNDLEVATEMARRMVCEFGMSEKLGHLTFGRKHHQVFLGRELGEDRNYSDQTAQKIDNEVREIIDSSYKRAKDLLTEKKDKLIKLADTLFEKEVLDARQARDIVGLPEPERNTDKDAAKDPQVPPASA